MTIRIGLSAAVVAAAIGVARPVEACSCDNGPACSAFYTADAVFTGTAAVTPLGPGSQLTRFVIDRGFRGPERGEIEVIGRGLGASCDFEFRDGVKYLVYARRDSARGWTVFLCSRTSPIAGAADDVRFVESVGNGSVKGGTVHGTATISEPDEKGRLVATGSLSGITITLMNDAHRFTRETNLLGRFEFRDVPPGKYDVTVRVPPAFGPVPPRAVEIKGPGGCEFYGFHATRKRR